MTKQFDKQKRVASLRRVLRQAVKEQQSHGTPIYESANFLMYALLREDSLDSLEQMIECEETDAWTVQKQLEAEYNCFLCDRDVEYTNFEALDDIGEAYDPEYNSPLDPDNFQSWLEPPFLDGEERGIVALFLVTCALTLAHVGWTLFH